MKRQISVGKVKTNLILIKIYLGIFREKFRERFSDLRN